MKPLPAGAEEWMEADIALPAGAADMTAFEQAEAFLADNLPVIGEFFKRGEIIRVEKRGVGDFGEEVDGDVERGEVSWMVFNLPLPSVAHVAAVMDVEGGGCDD